MNHKRRSQIAKMLEEQQTVTNKELMECFDISIETVRRDISYLEKQGILTKVYGGAVLKCRRKGSGIRKGGPHV